MSTHHTPDGSGLLHPLNPVAPAPKREALISLLVRRRETILWAWQREMDRITVPPHSVPSPKLLGFAFDACRDYLETGSTSGLNSLFERALHHEDAPGFLNIPSLHGAPGRADFHGVCEAHDRPADTAAQLHHVLGSMCLAVLPTLVQEFPGDLGSQQEAIALLLGAMDAGVVSVCKALERAIADEVLAAQERQVSFCKEVTRFATRDCLRLVEPHEIPVPDSLPVVVPIREARDGSHVRREAIRLAQTTELTSSQVEDLALAVGEAVSNVLKHAGEGIAHIWRHDQAVYVCLSDNGRGITLENLPKALSPGWSSEPSLGMGFTLMLEMADVIWLSTGSCGTTLCLEKSAAPREIPLLNALLASDLPD